MIEFEIHDNGWTVIGHGNLKEATQEDVNNIAKHIAKNTLVVFKKQPLDINDELRILKMFKNPEPLWDKDDPFFDDYAADVAKDPDGIICRVTNALRDGKPGMAGWEDGFDWHCNMPDKEDKMPIVWIYGVSGTKGSRTSFNNTVRVYEDLDQDTKTKLSKLHSIYGNIGAEEAPNHTGVNYNYGWTPPLVYTNIAGSTGLYLSPLQIQRFVELSQEESDALKDELFELILRDEYVYHHDWDDGDLLLTEQWLGIHKRWAFDKMDERILHRSAMDFPDQDYTL
jgi:alpha-ketoglutarate-dependent taurine dioxygenase